MTATEVKALTDRELDVLVAELVMGRMVENGREVESQTYREKFGSGSSRRIWQSLPRYSVDRNCTKVVLLRLRELDLQPGFVKALEGSIGIAPFLWLLASPRLLMEAALLAWEESK